MTWPKTKGKGKGKDNDGANGGETPKGGGKGNRQSVAQPRQSMSKLEQQMEKLLKRLDQTEKEVAKVVKATTPKVKPPGETQPKEARAKEQEEAEAKPVPKMLNNKGVSVPIAWTCPCGQPHWSWRAKACVSCKASRADALVSANLQSPAELGPFANPEHVSFFRRWGT